MNQFLKNLSDEQKVDALLYGSEKLIFSPNTKILRHTIQFLKAPNTLTVFFSKRNCQLIILKE